MPGEEGDAPAVSRKVLRLLQTAKFCGRALRPPASENAKSMRYNSHAAIAPKHAGHLPGVMQTTNVAKQRSAAPCWIKAHTFGLFRKSCGASRPQQRENGRFRGSPGAAPTRNCAGTAGFAAPGDVSPAAKRNRSSSGSPEKHLVRKRRGNGRFFPAPHSHRSSPSSVPVDEVDELLLGVGFGLLVNPADVGPYGAFGHA